MTATVKEDKRWSNNKKMEGEDGLRTLERLRGRLLKERQASMVAKEDAERMGNKLLDLESKLKEETKLRKKAEKKLKFLMKKVESSKISATLEVSEQSSSSGKCGFSCTSSSTITSGLKDIELEESDYKSQSTTSVASKDMKDNVLETTACNKNHFSLPKKESSSFQDTSDSNSFNMKIFSLDESSCESIASSQDSKADDKSSSSLKASMVEMETDAARNGSDNDEDYVDNSMAIVPVSLPSSNKTSELKILDQNVNEVLDALRHAREKIQRSMERRHMMIRVGPT